MDSASPATEGVSSGVSNIPLASGSASTSIGEMDQETPPLEEHQAQPLDGEASSENNGSGPPSDNGTAGGLGSTFLTSASPSVTSSTNDNDTQPTQEEEEEDIAFAAEAAANAVAAADAEQERLDLSMLRCRICGNGVSEERSLLRFLPLDQPIGMPQPPPSVTTFREDICLHVFCGKTANILVNQPHLEILTKAGLKNKHGIGQEVNAALARTRFAKTITAPNATTNNKEKQYYLVREFEAHLAAIRHVPVNYPEPGPPKRPPPSSIPVLVTSPHPPPSVPQPMLPTPAAAPAPTAAPPPGVSLPQQQPPTAPAAALHALSGSIPPNALLAAHQAFAASGPYGNPLLSATLLAHGQQPPSLTSYMSAPTAASAPANSSQQEFLNLAAGVDPVDLLFSSLSSQPPTTTGAAASSTHSDNNTKTTKTVPVRAAAGRTISKTAARGETTLEIPVSNSSRGSGTTLEMQVPPQENITWEGGPPI